MDKNLKHFKLLELFNNIILQGRIDDDWHVTIFNMIPKSGDLQNPANWRPIAILPILYKIFPRMIYHRLHPILDRHQSNDQFGFRPACRIDDAFIVLENMIGKSIEFNTPLWMASIDLRKAFDRIQYGPLFKAIRGQGISDSYIALLTELYRDQWGHVRGGSYFQIQRGVKQGDVISPMLFNAGLEMAIRSWKKRLTNHWIWLSDQLLRLTNTRYADAI